MPGQPGPVLVAGYVLYGGTLALSLGWTAWSIHRHGVWKRSTRRYSYYFYALLCAVRLAWLGTLARSPVDGTLSVDEFLSPGVSGLNRLALCLGHNAFSMVIFGWANVTAISYRSSAPMLTARRAFVGLNTINWAAHAGLYAAVHLAGFGRDADGGDARLAALTCLSVALLVAFAVVLTIAAAVFGMVLSMKFVQLAAAAADPTLGTYVSVKFNKINVAWHVFCVCFALRALCLGSSLPLGFEVHPAHYLLFGYYLPDVVPVVVALVVLRKKPMPFWFSPCCAPCCQTSAFEAGGELHQQLVFSPTLSASAGTYEQASTGSHHTAYSAGKSSSGAE